MRPWAAIARVPTSEGLVWFKENPDGNAFEPALTALLAQARPDALRKVVGHEGRLLLTRDAGPRFRALLDAGAPAPSWDDVLGLYGELHVDFMPLAEEALALGAPDERPARLPQLYEELAGRDAWYDRVAEAAASLGESVPVSVVHQEAHDGNVFVRDGQAVFIDWAEATVTHPFLGPLLPLRFATERSEYEPGSREVERLRVPRAVHALRVRGRAAQRVRARVPTRADRPGARLAPDTRAARGRREHRIRGPDLRMDRDPPRHRRRLDPARSGLVPAT
jgi:hypothetical protein